MKKADAVPGHSRGFTMVEIVLVVVILGTLLAMAVPRLAGRSGKAREEVAKADIQVNLPAALKLYELDNGVFPTSEQGLEALIKQPAAGPAPVNWNGPYLDKTPLDPWKRPYLYESPGKHRPHDYDLASLGGNSNPKETKDDITNW